MNSSKTKIFLTYFAAALVSLAVMVTIDYSLGDEAEFLNAWIIINKLLALAVTCRTASLSGSLVLSRQQ